MNMTLSEWGELEGSQIDLHAAIYALIWSDKRNAQELAFLYEYVDTTTYWFECFQFRNQQDFVNGILPANELSLRVDSLSEEGKKKLEEYFINTFGIDGINEAIKEEENYQNEDDFDDMSGGLEVKKETIEQIENAIAQRPVLEKFMKGIDMLEKEGRTDLIETAYWELVPDEDKALILNYFGKKYPHIASSIAKLFLYAYSKILTEEGGIS